MEGPIGFVTLEFLDAVVPTPVIEVTGPDGAPVSGLAEAELIADDVARVRFDPLTEAGDYQVDYTFVALDGATQQGAHRFTVLAASGPLLEVRPLLAWIVVAVLVGLVALALVARRRPAR